MNVRGIGKDISDTVIDGHLEQLEKCLAYVTSLGFEVAEPGITGLSVIVDGRLLPQRVERVQEVLSRFALRYTVHAPLRTNLAYGANLKREEQVMHASLEFCNMIGARVLVYHSGLQALDAARTGTVSLPDDETLERGKEREVELLRRLAPFAADMGVTIGMENGDPHLWEYAVLRANHRPAEELPRYHARLRIPPIVEQLEAVGHSAVGMTLDLAHLYLATSLLDLDYLEAVEQAAPWVRHLHINDNFGRLDVGYSGEDTRMPYGEGDLHLPPGWGAIPLAEAFRRLSGYEGDLILEIKHRYWDHFAEALENTSALLDSVR
jgi:sugar phosphate isomerase/epimerase